MSYNITNWKTKTIIDLKIPLDAFYRHPRADWHPRFEMKDEKIAILHCTQGNEILGTVEDGIFSIAQIELHGEGSGTFYNWILEPALRESTGRLEAVLIWEGGDYVSKLTVKNGIVADEQIDL